GVQNPYQIPSLLCTLLAAPGLWHPFHRRPGTPPPRSTPAPTPAAAPHSAPRTATASSRHALRAGAVGSARADHAPRPAGAGADHGPILAPSPRLSANDRHFRGRSRRHLLSRLGRASDCGCQPKKL